jgi:hypothetical protein
MTAGTELLFRNVDARVDDPVETWPVEALATALERGSLTHWRRIRTAIEQDPWGPVARSVEQIVAGGHIYGVGPGMQRSIASARATWAARERQAVAAELTALVAASGLTAAQFAERLGTSASRLSTYLSGRVTPSATLLVRARRISSLRASAG